MTIDVLRYNDTGDATLSLIRINALFECYGLEDEYRSEKVMHETRIPEGKYKIKLRTYGGHHEKYLNKYDFHEGMLQVMDVPGFSDILIHTGNTEKHTSGCLLVGSAVTAMATISGSVDAYTKFYPKVLRAIKNGEPVNIIYSKIYNSI